VTLPEEAARTRAIRAYFEDSLRVKRAFADDHAERLGEAAQMVIDALGAGGKVLLFGNGGSAADAQHVAAELVGRLRRERRALAAIALTTDTSALTAIANDYGYDEVFARQVRGLGRQGDVAVAISTSGNSPGILKAVAACRELGVRTIGLTGGSGGKLAGVVDCALVVSSTTDTQRIQETHILIGHVLCELVDEHFGDGA
jgi:D-sedoheptulose 7-phosphate isomerase